MRIYHFLNEKYGIQAIQNEELKVGRINELNDPFEHGHLENDNYVTHTIVKGRRNKANQKHGIICFSKNYSSPVQWAHYSDSHRGICLGFDAPKEDLIEISYIDERGQYNEFKESLKYSSKEFLKYMLSKKYKHWSYEEEVRFIVGFGEKEKDNGLVFRKFSEKLAFAEVIIGCRSTLRKKDIKKLLRENGRDAEISLAVPSKTEYKMEK